MLKAYIITKLALVAASSVEANYQDPKHQQNILEDFITYLDSKKDKLSQEIDKTFKEEVSQVRDACKTLESSINKQLENNDQLSNEDINEIYDVTNAFLALAQMEISKEEHMEKTEHSAEDDKNYSAEDDNNFVMLYGDKLNNNSRKQMNTNINNLLFTLTKIFKNVPKKNKKIYQEITTEFFEKHSLKQNENQKEIKEIFNARCLRKFWEKCNFKFERKKDSNNKSLIVKTVGSTLLFHIPIYGCTGYLLYDKLFKKNQKNIGENEPTPAVSAPAP